MTSGRSDLQKITIQDVEGIQRVARVPLVESDNLYDDQGLVAKVQKTALYRVEIVTPTHGTLVLICRGSRSIADVKASLLKVQGNQVV